MTFGIAEVQQAYNLWKQGKKEQQSSFAVSFSLEGHTSSLIFMGISSIQRFLGEKIFPQKVIAYLHSLLQVDGAFLFPDEFVKDLSNLAYDVRLWAPQEGRIIFQQEPVVKVEGSSLVLFFFKKLLSYYLPLQIQIATKVEKIASFVSPGFVVTQNLEEYSSNIDHLYTKAAFAGGAIATQDLFAASFYKIPLCFHGAESSFVFLDINAIDFKNKIARLEPEEKVFLTGGVTFSWLEEHSHLLLKLKGVLLNLSNLCNSKLELNWHSCKPLDILDIDFNVYRLSHKGLYCGDILTSDGLKNKRTILGRSIGYFTREKILVEYTKEIEPLQAVKKRVQRNMRSLPCKYSGNYAKNPYPVRVLKKSKAVTKVV